MKYILIIVCLCAINSVLGISAQEKVQKTGFAGWWDSLVNGNVDKTFEKPVDMTYAFAPYYTQESSFGVGGQMSALYRLDRTDSIMQPSDFTILGGISVNGTYSFGVEGNNHFTRDKRLKYIAEFRNQNRNFWGINFAECDKNPESKVNFKRVNVSADYQQRILGNWFWGVAMHINYKYAKPDSMQYLLGQSKDGLFTGFGVSLMYDSRDYILNPKRGLHFFLRHVAFPSFLGKNEKYVGCTTLQFDYYHHLWPGSTLAYDFYYKHNISSGDIPWQMREEICYDDRRMRGYYAGRYTDDGQISTQLELRQNIYKRLGAVAWAGAGSMFHKLSEVKGHQILPNYGIGLRFELKKDTNIRMDFGYGRNESSIIFNFGEAF